MIKISKMEAARRQLKTAIRLFFKRDDEVSIHALVSNAHSILSDIAKNKNIQSMKNSDMIRPEMHKEFIDIIHKPQNFFKHANRDASGQFDFHPELTAYYILDSLHIYCILEKYTFPEASAFLVWFSLNKPHLLNLEVVEKFIDFKLNVSANDFELFDQAIEYMQN